MPIPQLLVLDADLLFSQRLCELAKRRWPTTQYMTPLQAGPSASNGDVSLRADEVLRHAHASGHTILLISSEALLFADNDKAREQLIHELATISKDASVRLVVVAFDSVLSATEVEGRLQVTDTPPVWYRDALARLRDSLDSRNAVIVAAPPYLTHCESRIQSNPAHAMLRTQVSAISGNAYPSALPQQVVLADRIIDDLLEVIGDLVGATVDAPQREGRDGGLPTLIQPGVANRTARGNDPTLATDEPESPASHDGDLAMLPVQIHCSLKVLYRKAPEEQLADGTVAQLRQRLGRRLAAALPDDVIQRIDVVVPVPETGRWYAAGVAEALGKPCVDGIHKRVNGRSFDIQNHARRREFIKMKLDVDAGLLSGKSIAIVDEAIFTGATLRQVAMLLRETDVASVFLLIASPECKNRCAVNMQPDRAMLSEYVRDEALSAYFDVNGVFFQNEHDYESMMASAGYHCTRCFRATKAW